MPDQKISNKNQTGQEFRFAGFQLSPSERLLKRDGAPVPLTAKTLDMLLCLVSNAGRLVSKDELMEAVWPGTFVAEANLTNAIVSLRKVMGRESIRTVSKYGYRFEVPVEGEPGISSATYELFSRAKELTAHRSLESVVAARELYWLCLAGDPAFAPAWAWLGRNCALLAKISDKGGDTELKLAHAAMKRAFAIEPDLACAHQFYTTIQTDTGEALEAMERLQARLRRHPAEPETFAGLVQALRFCGLLEESLQMHRKAVDLDPIVQTSVPHTYFLRGEFHATIESYSGRGALYLDAAAWAALGDREGARALLAQRVSAGGCAVTMQAGMESLLAITEGRFEDAVARMETRVAVADPEMVFYMARHHAYMGRAMEAQQMIRTAMERGFTVPRQTLCGDPWLASVRADAGFGDLMRRSEELVERARKKWLGREVGFDAGVAAVQASMGA